MVDVPAPGVTTAAAVPDRVGRFVALRLPVYRVLWTSSVFMFFAMASQQVARGWLAIELTGTNAGIGGVFLAFGLPILVLSPMGGVLADRFPKRTVYLSCQSAILAGSLIVVLAVTFEFLEYWMLLGSAAVHGGGIAVLGPTQGAYISEVLDRGVLSNGIVLNQLAVNGTRVIGPTVAGALIGVRSIGAGGVYVFTSALFVVAISVSVFLPRVAPKGRIRTSGIGELLEGLRYVRSQPPVLLLIAVSAIVVMVGMPYLAFLPYFAKDIFDVGSSGYGLMSTVGAIGAVTASVWIAGRITRTNLWRLQARCGLCVGIGVLLLGLSPTYAISLVALGLLGAAIAGFQGTNSSLVLTETDLEYHGRLQSLVMMGYAASGIMSLPLGVMADQIGLRQTVAAMGVVCIATMAGYMVVRRRYASRVDPLNL